MTGSLGIDFDNHIFAYLCLYISQILSSFRIRKIEPEWLVDNDIRACEYAGEYNSNLNRRCWPILDTLMSYTFPDLS